MSIDTQRYVMGAGKVYLSETSSPPYFYVAETPSLSLTVASETTQLLSSDSKVASVLCEVQGQQTITGQLVTNNISARHVAMFLGGATTESSAGGGAAATFDIDPVVLDLWYQLGYTAPNTGHMHVSDVSAAEDPDGTPQALALGVDYEIEPVGGLIRFLSSSSLVSAGDEVRVTYDWAAGTDVVVSVTEGDAPVYTLVFDSDNQGCTPDLNNRVVLGAVRLLPSGDLALKSRTEYQSITWDLAVMKPLSGDTIRVIQRVAS